MKAATMGFLAALALTSSGAAFAGQSASPPPKRPDAAPPPAAAASTTPAAVQVHTRVNQTAVWVGDPIVWTVELVCAPTVDVIADDLAGEKLTLTGLELLGSEAEKTTNADGTTTHRMTYRFGAFEVGQPQLKVGSLKVRYYERRAGQRVEDVTPAGEAVVPAATIAWRSTIPPALEAIALREERPAQAAPWFLAWARPVGLTLLVMSIAPVALWVIGRVRRMQRPKERRPSIRASRKEARSELTSLLAADTGTEAERREAYARLNTVVRRYVADTTGVAAMALTPAEIAAGSNGHGARASLAELGEVLAECERARYGPAEQVPSADRFRDSVATVERLV